MDKYENTKYFSKKKFMKLAGNEIKIFNEDKSQLMFYVKQKAFKLKEDITVYSDESKQDEIIKIKARSIVDFSAAYDVTDAKTGDKLGVLRRKGFKSIIRDEWELLDVNDQTIGKVIEDSGAMALLRRFISLIPQTYYISVGEDKVGTLKQTFNPFIAQFRVDFSEDTKKILDRETGIAITVLLQVIEGRQN